ncbi:hypothetical protein LguiB_006844 [Lonicera macranthoides]
MIRIGGLYAQKVETFTDGLCDSSFVSLYGLRLIESQLLRVSKLLPSFSSMFLLRTCKPLVSLAAGHNCFAAVGNRPEKLPSDG